MKFRFASWNVNNRNLTSMHLRLFRDIRADLLALQEVSATFHTALAATQLFLWSTSSLAIRPSKVGEGKSRRLGCSIFGRQPFSLVTSTLVPRLAFPERALVVSLDAPGRQVTACSFHTPPGASWDEVKPRTLKIIARWLRSQPVPLIFGIDANTPKTDHPDISRNEWWWKDEPLLLGPAPLHALKDAFRLFLEAHPAEKARVVRKRPNGPLAVSYLRGTRRKKTECRYDFIYVSSDIRVKRVQYRFDTAVKRASDHALAIGDFEIKSPFDRHDLGHRLVT